MKIDIGNGQTIEHEGLIEVEEYKWYQKQPARDHQRRLDQRFVDGGDSGSVIVDEHNRVVGLLFLGTEEGDKAMAIPIHRILDRFNNLDRFKQSNLKVPG